MDILPISNYINHRADLYATRISNMYKETKKVLSDDNIEQISKDCFYAGFLQKHLKEYNDDILWKASCDFGKNYINEYTTFYDIAFHSFICGYQTELD